MAHWSESYIGQPFILGEADCMHLFAQVSREVFHRLVPDGATIDRAISRLGRVAQMSDGMVEFGQPTEAPSEGDAVLMFCCGRPSHIGVYCRVDNEPSVLHAMQNAGMAVRHSLRDLPRYGLRIEGFYTWK